MNILAVDDEPSALEALERSIRMADPAANVVCFRLSGQALEYAKENQIDTAFLDIEMIGMNGLTLAKHLQELCRDTNIVFVTGFNQYTGDAIGLRVSGYVMKPVDPQQVREELDNLRHPPVDSAKLKQLDRLGRYTFDHNFKRVYCDGNDLLLLPREYNIFYQLAAQPGVYFTPQELYEKAAGQEATEDISVLYSHISRLRKKLERDSIDDEPDIGIEQSRGKGYRLVVHR